jgi:hypothetical protein
MAATDQYAVKALAREIDPPAVESWPARESMALDGWLLRFTDGFSSRSNSVSTLDYGGPSLAESIARAEAAYRTRGLAPLFQITPATTPGNLESELKRRGYVAKPPTMLMVGEARTIAGESDMRISSAADVDFERLTREGSHSPEDGDERLETLARAPLPKAFVVDHADGQSVACGASVVTGRWAGVFVMRTAPASLFSPDT